MSVSVCSQAWAVSDVTTTCKQEVAFDNHCYRDWAHRGTETENTVWQEDWVMGFVQHKGEEDDDMRILMWMSATVEEGKEVWAMGKRSEVLILEKSLFWVCIKHKSAENPLAIQR